MERYEMDNKPATHHDAEVILKLYDLRREAVLRKARHWLLFEFKPKSVEEFSAIMQNQEAQENAYYRQVITYWEMAASLVLRGALNAELFLDTNGEGIFIFAKLQPFRDAIEARSGRPFMRHTAQLINQFPAAQALFQGMAKSLQSRAS
jgi:hypothetical protein